MANKSDEVVAYDFNKKPYNVEVNELQWRPAAYGVVIKDNKILLLRQVNGYDLPGGGLEKGESPEDAVIREVKEETGIVVSLSKIVHVGTSFFKPFKTEERYVQSISMYFECKYIGGELSIEGFDEMEKVYAEEPEWIELDKLDKLKIGSTADFRPCVKKAMQA